MQFFADVIGSSSWSLYIIILGLIFTATSILFFRSGVLCIGQLVVLALYTGFGAIAGVGVLLAVVQVLLSLYIIYRLKVAIDYNYQLVIEKTHQIPPNITKTGNGTRPVF